MLVSNHPLAGGSHLPDITVITPVFVAGSIVFFVASRGHHQDVGGISPGSMPPASHQIEEEGAAITSFKLVKDGQFQVSVVSVHSTRLLSCRIRRAAAQRLRCLVRPVTPCLWWQEDGISALLMAPAQLADRIPGISGTRALGDNLSDLKAQVAANNRGIALVIDLIKEYSLEVVQAYMHHIQVYARLPRKHSWMLVQVRSHLL